LAGKAVAAAQPVNRIADLKPEGIGDPPGLGNHKHRFGQGVDVGLLQRLQLLQAHVQPLGQFGPTDSLGFPGLKQPIGQKPECRRSVGLLVRPIGITAAVALAPLLPRHPDQSQLVPIVTCLSRPPDIR
jgi:hypothetical protein